MKNIQNNNGKNKKNIKKSSDPWARSGERPGRGHGSELFFLFFHGFLQFGQNLQNTKKKPKKSPDPWARSGLSTHKPKNQKTKKPKNQKTKKTKKTKKTRPNTLHLTPSPWGVQSWFFRFFGFLFFWFLGFLGFWFFGLCVDSPDLAHGSELFVFFLIFLCSRGFGQTAKNHGKTKKQKKQKTKKPKNQKNQKTKKKTKPRLHTPRGGGQMQSVGSCLFVFLFFFGFFGLDSHCRCAKQRLPGTVSGCTRSKVDTLQYSNICYDIVRSANEQQRGMEFNFVRLRHMLLDLCTGNAAICALPQWPVL